MCSINSILQEGLLPYNMEILGQTCHRMGSCLHCQETLQSLSHILLHFLSLQYMKELDFHLLELNLGPKPTLWFKILYIF